MSEQQHNLDIDALETREWLNALQNILEQDGSQRAKFLLNALAEKARTAGVAIASGITTPYINTIAVQQQPQYPGDLAMEERISALIRWNAIATVVRANRFDGSLGGHLASYASSTELYEVGFHHHFHGAGKAHGGDLIFVQGHSSPGIYARAFLEGRLTAEQLSHFRREVYDKGIPSYPHPRTMPEFWQFPTVSMGLGPLQAIYQARFLKYLHNQGLADTSQRKVWAFCGDGEMDEPESLGALHIAANEALDNLIFVVSCNLQRLDGPVRGNGKIITELEGIFTGASWNVNKVLWASEWDALLAKDTSGLLIQRMEACVDGEFQTCTANGGAYFREHFFGKYPELQALVQHLSDDDIAKLRRGGHDPLKVHAAYHQAMQSNGKPTVVLAHTVKGYGIDDVANQNTAHNQKKLTDEQLKVFRDRFDIPIADKDIGDVPFYRPDKDSAELQYLHERREKLLGYLPARRTQSTPLPVPALDEFAAVLKGSGEREISSNMMLVRVLTALYKDKQLKNNVVTIIPDESRTLGLEGLFRQIGIYAHQGQQYQPVDGGQLIYYKEDKKGQILQEGLNEAGAFSSWIAAATSYSVSDIPIIPFYFYYSMFGFQRIADLAWAAGDSRARGFLIGGLSGRTALPGEGLQHDDGHSHVLASTIPCCMAYDPTYGYETAVIIHDGLKRMMERQEDVFYYITMTNENHTHPAMPEAVEQGIIKGLYLLHENKQAQVQLLGCGTILREVEAAAQLLAQDFSVQANVWSAPSFNELRKDGLIAARWNLLHPEQTAKQSYVAHCLLSQQGPIIAATDYMKIYADQVREFLPGKTYTVLGTDGFGLSDIRSNLRQYFAVDRHHIVLATLKSLADDGEMPVSKVSEAISKYNINVDSIDPTTI